MTTTAAVPRPRSLPWEVRLFNLLFAGWCFALVFVFISAWTVEEAMRETRELRERGALCPHPAILNMPAGPAWTGSARIMMCDETTCRMSL